MLCILVSKSNGRISLLITTFSFLIFSFFSLRKPKEVLCTPVCSGHDIGSKISVDYRRFFLTFPLKSFGVTTLQITVYISAAVDFA